MSMCSNYFFCAAWVCPDLCTSSDLGHSLCGFQLVVAISWACVSCLSVRDLYVSLAGIDHTLTLPFPVKSVSLIATALQPSTLETGTGTVFTLSCWPVLQHNLFKQAVMPSRIKAYEGRLPRAWDTFNEKYVSSALRFSKKMSLRHELNILGNHRKYFTWKHGRRFVCFDWRSHGSFNGSRCRTIQSIWLVSYLSFVRLF